MAHLPRLALTVGDPAGIGPEIVLKALAHPDVSKADWVIYGSNEVMKATASALGLCSFDASGASIVDVGGDIVPTGIVSAEAGRQAATAVIRAAEDALKGVVQGIVTAPLNKEAIHIAGFNYPGHTEMLAHIANTPNVAMMFVGGKLRVALLTIHAPLKDVARLITEAEIIRVATLVHESLPRFGTSSGKRKIAIAGLNPHAGENGHIGTEERDIFPGALSKLRAAGVDIEGPFPGDTLFVRAAKGDFDGVIACYHDQGLIPVKLLAFGEAVNVTLGLPFLRTSVDHGTGFDIAGKSKADEGSLLAAMRLAVQLARP
ncbi:MAG: 4-hydroxythreonine-4-phosphate dehydrogenase PdxA [Vicinamibacteria bacterium]